MYLPRSHKPRRGKVVVMLALSLTGIIGYMAVALEGGLLMDNKRNSQAAADTSALAAASSLYDYYVTYQGKDHSNIARDAAINTAKLMGFKKDGVQSTV